MAAQDNPLPLHVQQEFAEYLKCGRLEHGFLRVQCSECHHEHLVAFSCKRRGFCPSCGARRMAESAALLVDEVLPEQPIRQWVLSFPFQLRFLFASRPQLVGRILGIVYRVLSAQLIQKVGFTRKTAQNGAVTLIQRFGSALNLNVHFHMLFLDGVYTITPWGKSRFHRTNAPAQRELTELVHTISHRVAGYLERQGILERDEENSYLNLEEGDEDPMQQVLGCSVNYRIAIGPRQGRKVFRLQTIPSWEKDERLFPSYPLQTATLLRPLFLASYRFLSQVFIHCFQSVTELRPATPILTVTVRSGINERFSIPFRIFSAMSTLLASSVL
ncbi:MAG: transposase zinc-binding domain-containing protein [Candidatus Thiodiazotropha sp. (ex Codakia orbicularis)]|nr:transposase zinc-binding domain-containing protein [Candidatus Thiodiazotropha sp. (ex Codakia orbicularis)]